MTRPTATEWENAFAHLRASIWDRPIRPAPISTLLPIGLPPISVQEIEALRVQCGVSEFLRDAIDDAFSAFLEGKRAELYRIFVFACESCRFYGRNEGLRGRAGHEILRALVVATWRLLRETPAS